MLRERRGERRAEREGERYIIQEKKYQYLAIKNPVPISDRTRYIFRIYIYFGIF